VRIWQCGENPGSVVARSSRHIVSPPLDCVIRNVWPVLSRNRRECGIPHAPWVAGWPLTENGLSGWILYCSCGSPRASSKWQWSELKPYEVRGPAYRRGYGSPDEVWDVTRDKVDSNWRDVEMPSISENDFECLSKTGMKSAENADSENMNSQPHWSAGA